jgi:7-cyano-7-deazaguanine reductase
MRQYTTLHAASGLNCEFPDIECWENQFPGYDITLINPEFSSICPRTGLPDVGTITSRYRPSKWCLETKSLKMYFTSFRNVGIFTENVVNQILKDVVRAAKPRWAEVEGVFASRGGIEARITAAFGKKPR